MVAPQFTSWSVTKVLAGQGDFTLHCYGTGFTATTVGRINFTDYGSAYVSPTELTCTVPGSLMGSATTLLLEPYDPTNGSGTIKTITVASTNDTPSMSGLSADPVYFSFSDSRFRAPQSGGPDTIVYVMGTNFMYGQTVPYIGGVAAGTYEWVHNWPLVQNGNYRILKCTLSYAWCSANLFSFPSNSYNQGADVRTPAPGGGNSSGVFLYLTPDYDRALAEPHSRRFQNFAFARGA